MKSQVFFLIQAFKSCFTLSDGKLDQNERVLVTVIFFFRIAPLAIATMQYDLDYGILRYFCIIELRV